MFNLFETEFIRSPAILVCFNSLVGRRKVVAISIFEIVLPYYNKNGYYLAHKKTYLIEILDIGLYNIIFGNYILEKSKSNPNNL